MRATPTNRRSSPLARGVTLFELTVALGLLAVFVGSAAHVVAALAVGQRTADRRAAAQRAIDNLHEQLSAAGDELLTTLTNEQTTPRELAEQALPPAVLKQLPDAQLTCQIQEETDPVAAQRVTLGLSWTNPHGRPARPVRLTSWVFPSTMSRTR